MSERKELNVGVRLSRLSGTFFKGGGEGGDAAWLSSIASKTAEWVSKAGRNIKAHWESVKGGAKAVVDNIFQGNWGFFRDWFNEAPLLPKVAGTGAALLTSAVALFVGGAVVGGIGTGIKGIAAKIGLTNGILLSAALPQIMETTINAVEYVYNFDWAVPDSKIIQQCKEAAERIYEPLGEAMGIALASIVVGKVGSASVRADIDIELAAAAALINPSIEERIVDALTDLLSTVKTIAYEILFLQTYSGVRRIAGAITGNDEWGEDGQQPFVISKKVEEVYEEVKASEYLGHLNDKQWEGIEAFGTSFYDTMKELLTEEDTYVNWQKGVA